MVDKKLIEYILSVLVIVIPTIIIILEIYYRRKKKNIETRKDYYIRKVNSFFEKDTQRRIDSISELTKEFFKEVYVIKVFRGYYDLERFFLKNDLKEEAEFSRRIGDLLYADEKPTKKQNKELEERLKKIIAKTDIPEEKKE